MRRPPLGHTIALTSAGVVTTWCAMLSWRGFTDDQGQVLYPLLAIGVVVGGLGVAGRWARFGVLGTLLLQVLGGAMITSYLICGAPVPVGGAWTELRLAFSDAWVGARTYAAPVPSDQADVGPLMLAGGLGCFLVVDLLVGSLRRASLAGLPLLTVFSVPTGLIAEPLSWWVFTLTAVGFVTMLFLQEAQRLAHWGRPLVGSEREVASPSTSSSVLRSAGLIGGTATAFAIMLPAIIPTLDVHLLDVGNGAGGNGEISIKNPMTDLRRDLKRPDDVPLLRVVTDDPDPSYLRISVLTRFSDNEWSSGDRDIPTSNRADGPMPPLVGVSPDVKRSTYTYDVDVLDTFSSTWLPTKAPIDAIDAQGDWRFDPTTTDFIASDDDLDTAGLSYTMDAVDLDLTPRRLEAAPLTSDEVPAAYTQLPSDLPPIVSELARKVTQDATTPFAKAVALQNWFWANFTYSLEQSSPIGNGVDALERFLRPGPQGRIGYCEQFASAMAVMAREIGLPARVAVGFLSPRTVGLHTYEFSSDDLHAWPEIFLQGSGWVKFEPTPDDPRADRPAYTLTAGAPSDPSVSSPSTRDPGAQASSGPSASQTQKPKLDQPTSGADAEADRSRGNTPTLPIGLAALLVLAVGAGLTPRELRRRRRVRRLAGDTLDAWAEVRDTVVDLRISWPVGRSPRQTGAFLGEHLGDPDSTSGTPAHSPTVSAALRRVVDAVERAFFSREGVVDVPGLTDDAALVVRALEAGATPRARRRATWLPASLLRRTPATTEVSTSSSAARAVDRVS
ncbi:transglutaminase domain-containing protein [Nocardioides sp. CBS4Y-1]|uniref:Transglutaminase domain-containing protein n=1 Tax=Nocardioides acrostichi TaxID=2784339 RepID=A0A930Y9Q4_9ACTN|nr:transglutaminase domain-containing protein [Nocardioides acrostichi]